MSLETWNLKYYPVAAWALTGASKAECLRHSLRKWWGLRTPNLRPHGLSLCCYVPGDYFKDATYYCVPGLDVNSETCALCENWLYSPGCPNCPIVTACGVPCDSAYIMSPYQEWIRSGNPQRMICVLIQALRQELKAKLPDQTA